MTTSNWAAQEATKSLKSTLGIGANEVLNAQQQRPLVAHPPVSTMSYAAQAGKQIARAPVEMPGNSYGNLDVQFGSFDSALPSFDDAGKVAGQKILSSATGMGAGGGGGGFPPATPPKADQQINQLLKSAATAQDPYRSAAVGVAKQNLTGSSLKPATEPPGKKPASQQQPADLLSSIATSNYPGGAVAGGNAYLHSATPNITTTPHKAQTPGK